MNIKSEIAKKLLDLSQILNDKLYEKNGLTDDVLENHDCG